LLNAIIYFSSSENINGSNLTSCLTTVKSVTASLVVSEVTTSRLSLPPSSLFTVTTLAAGLATVKPSTAFKALNILSAVVLLDSFALTK